MVDNTPKVVEDCHDLLAWIIPHLERFPRTRRFTLGERIETGLLEVLEACVSAAYAKDKRPWLEQANRRLNVVRHLWRLAHELRDVAPRQYAHGSQKIVEIGAQLGGWRKQLLG